MEESGIFEQTSDSSLLLESNTEKSLLREQEEKKEKKEKEEKEEREEEKEEEKVQDGVKRRNIVELELEINNFSRLEPQVLFIKHRKGVPNIHHDISIFPSFYFSSSLSFHLSTSLHLYLSIFLLLFICIYPSFYFSSSVYIHLSTSLHLYISIFLHLFISPLPTSLLVLFCSGILRGDMVA